MNQPTSGDLADHPPTGLDAEVVHPARLLAVESDPAEVPWVIVVVDES